jgi:hypothetical protein
VYELQRSKWNKLCSLSILSIIFNTMSLMSGVVGFLVVPNNELPPQPRQLWTFSILIVFALLMSVVTEFFASGAATKAVTVRSFDGKATKQEELAMAVADAILAAQALVLLLMVIIVCIRFWGSSGFKGRLSDLWDRLGRGHRTAGD